MIPRPHLLATVANVLFLVCSHGVDAFAPATPTRVSRLVSRHATTRLRMGELEESPSATVATDEEEEEEIVDAATLLQLEKQKRADELRAQEVFMKRSTGIYSCSNCDFEYDPEKGDSYLIGGMIKPGTAYEDLPSNWRCPTCRASKDNFAEKVETIPGFEVNQGYGFGTNSMTTGEKNTLIWGSIVGFFLLFIGGYALS